MRNILDIFSKLDINKENGLFITSEDIWKEECQIFKSYCKTNWE
jgi:hypothetical protein